jgi:uncharacterized membrane protein YkvA (DUF1232 family)
MPRHDPLPASDRRANDPVEHVRARRGLSLTRIPYGWLAFAPLVSRMPLYARLMVTLLADSRVPASRKAAIGAAAAYLVFGRDLIPDRIPILGGLDDVIVVVLAVEILLDGVPEDILGERLDELAIDREAFERDIWQIRRLTPPPVRRAIRAVPRAIDVAGSAAAQTGLAPRIRAMLTREDSTA